MPCEAIGRKYQKQISRSVPGKHIRKHKNFGHHLERVAPHADPGTLTAIKEERHRKTIEERIDELYDLALAGSQLAIKKPKPDIRGLAACVAQGIAATALLCKPLVPGTKINIQNNITSDPFERMKIYEKYFADMENDTKRASSFDSNGSGKPILQAETDEKASGIPGQA